MHVPNQILKPQYFIFVPLAFLCLSLSACGSGAVHLEPASDAANPNCAKAMVAMPQELGGYEQRETTAQATTAWGDPATVIVKCGIEIPEPVSDPCVSVNGVDWIVKQAEEGKKQDPGSVQSATGTWTATTFGRTPALQVTFDAEKISSSSLLLELGSPVTQLEQTQKCTNLDDTLTVDQ
ncbi:DUF3515 domain-containing protein [uncultured Rothia sp.]|uniref:DUF3515 domain-containing protein n=1 Tax=uncultured Rothia sp. TaxID=316088 RepID=UPI0032179BCB